jgi:hypothetical protein
MQKAEAPAGRLRANSTLRNSKTATSPRIAYLCVRDEKGNVLARMESRHVHGVGVDSKGDIYARLTQDRSGDKQVRVG